MRRTLSVRRSDECLMPTKQMGLISCLSGESRQKINIGLSGYEVVVPHYLEVERYVGLYAAYPELLKGPRHPRNGLFPGSGMHDELGKEVVIVRRHVIAAVYG